MGLLVGVLKQYIRELPEPLMLFSLYDEWIQASSIQDSGAKLQAYWGLVDTLPKANKDNLRYLICFLGKLSEYVEINKMSCSNIAIVIAPNIIYSEKELSDAVNLHHTSLQSAIVEALIQHHKWFFPEGVDFFHQSPVEQNGSNSASNTSSNTSPGSRPSPDPVLPNQSSKKTEVGFQSVTGGLLEEVVNLINASGGEQEENRSSPSPDQEPTKNQIHQSTTPSATSGQHSTTKVTVVAHDKKKPAPTPAQVKFIGSTSPTTSSPPTHYSLKPIGLPPPPPTKNAAAPPLAPKPGRK